MYIISQIMNINGILMYMKGSHVHYCLINIVGICWNTKIQRWKVCEDMIMSVPLKKEEISNVVAINENTMNGVSI